MFSITQVKKMDFDVNEIHINNKYYYDEDDPSECEQTSTSKALLFMAVDENMDISVIQILLKLRANPNIVARIAKRNYFTSRGPITTFDDTVLNASIRRNNYDLTKLLLEHGCDPNSQVVYTSSISSNDLITKYDSVLKNYD